ncbi:MAG: transporter substrate-binding domain-containing protein [Phycisphaerales bacterium]
MRLGVGNWYFWNVVQDSQFSGAVVDIWQEIAKRNDLRIEFVPIESMEHLKTAMEDGSIDAFCSVRKTPEREAYMLFIEPPFRTKLQVLTYVRTGSGVSISKYEDMHGRKVAIVEAGYDRLNRDPDIDKVTIGANTAEAFDMLLAGTVDAVHICQWRAVWQLRNGEYRNQIALADYAYREYHPCYLVMAKKSALAERWKDRFGRTIQHMIDDGTMKHIVDSYVPGWYEYYLP